MKKVLIILIILVLIIGAYYFFIVKKKKEDELKTPAIVVPAGSVQSDIFKAATKEALAIINNSPVFTDAKKQRIQTFLPDVTMTKDQETIITSQAMRDNTSLTNAILKNILQRLDNQLGVPDGTNYSLLVSGGRG